MRLSFISLCPHSIHSHTTLLISLFFQFNYVLIFVWSALGWHCTGDRDQDHPHGKEMQKGKMVVWGGLTNCCEKKRSEKQRRKGKIFPFESRVPKNSKERKPSSAISAKKQRKTTEWERLEISSGKIRDTIGTFHAKMGSIKDRNGMDLTEAEDIKKRW